jgi:uncharacterized protein
VLVKGNHDTLLGPLEKDIELVQHMALGGFYFTHGHKLDDNAEFRAAHTLVIGHEHPAVSISRGARKETYKAFLVGTYRQKQLIVLPSCNLVVPGTPVLSKGRMSPYLKQPLSEFKVFLVDDKPYYFGKLKDVC